MTQFATERADILAHVKDVLYDQDWINSQEVERVKESSEFKRIFAQDFSGYGRLTVTGSLERLYGIRLDDAKVKKMVKVGDLVDAVMAQLEIADEDEED